jgi:hypothetical protein
VIINDKLAETSGDLTRSPAHPRRRRRLEVIGSSLHGQPHGHADIGWRRFAKGDHSVETGRRHLRIWVGGNNLILRPSGVGADEVVDEVTAYLRGRRGLKPDGARRSTS